MSALFAKVFRQALKTFEGPDPRSFQENFLLLKQLTDQLHFKDLHLSPTGVLNENAASYAYVDIWKDDIVCMGVFLLPSGYTIPLHDHPMMHGLLRCIYGQIRVQSYTQMLAPNESLIYNPNLLEVNVVAEQPRNVGPDTECAVLTPRERNFHEITALGGVAAFFDILSPPYEVDMPLHGKRKCRYYSKIEESCSTISPILCLKCVVEPTESSSCHLVRKPDALRQCIDECAMEAYRTRNC